MSQRENRRGRVCSVPKLSGTLYGWDSGRERAVSVYQSSLGGYEARGFGAEFEWRQDKVSSD